MARLNRQHTQAHGALGERLRRRRKALGLTAKALAKVAGVSPSYVSQLEHGKQDQPSLDVLGALAAALGSTPAELLGAPIAAPVPSRVPPALAALAAEMGLDPVTTAMLATINLEGRQPTTREGWLLVVLAIQHACANPVSRESGVTALG